jgi:catechol 1,2-dioxygenase
VIRINDAAAIHKAGLNKPYAYIKFDFVIGKEVPGAPSTLVRREHAPAH